MLFAPQPKGRKILLSVICRLTSVIYRGRIINLVIPIPVCVEHVCVLPVLTYRYIRHGYTFRRIPLTRGKYAIVETGDYWPLSKHKWHANGKNGKFYAARTIFTEDGKRHLILMHRQVLRIPPYIFVDHINHNGLDNRKANLRPATRAQNGQNRVKFKNRIYGSKFKGVTWNRKYKNWQAQIQVNGKLTFLGRFTDEITAAKAYDRAAKKYYGQFASPNFPHPAH